LKRASCGKSHHLATGQTGGESLIARASWLAGLVLTAALVFAVGPAQAAPGDLDPSFGTAGLVTTSNGAAGNAMVLQGDGKIVVAGRGQWFVALARYNSDGSLDPSFGSGGSVTTPIGAGNLGGYALALQPDGKILVPGGNVLLRYNSDGSLDTSFGTNGSVSTQIAGVPGFFGEPRVQPDGKIVVPASAPTAPVGTTSPPELIRYSPDGSLDPSFGAGGIVTIPASVPATALTLQQDGKILAAGGTNTTPSKSLLFRYRPDGSLDSSFGVGGEVTTGVVVGISALAIQADGKILIAGATSFTAAEGFALARFTDTGSLDQSFGTNGVAATGFGQDSASATSLVLQSNGKIVVGGGSTLLVSDDLENDYLTWDTESVLARLSQNGALDTSFGHCGLVQLDLHNDPTQGMQGWSALALQPDGKILAAGPNGGRGGFAVARYLGGDQQPVLCYSLTIGNGNGFGVEGSRVVSTPAGISCTGCSVDFPAGSSVTIQESAVPGTSLEPALWGGDCTGHATKPCTLTMNQDHVVSLQRPCVVPGVKGWRLFRARRAIHQAGCTLGRIRRARSTSPKARVIAQRPAAGTLVKRGTKVRLIVSDGKRR
jgi:uncharacterized delta-60 repeat protein